MYEYIKGTLEELSPAEAVVECHGIGFRLQISLNTYDRLQGQKEVKIYVYHHIREDEETLYGFCDKEERRIFILLIGVSGIGPNTARMVLSSLTADEVSTAVISGDVNRIKGVKGIGLKTAQKVIIELKDKISKGRGGTGSHRRFGRSKHLGSMLGSDNARIHQECGGETVAAIVKKEPGLSLEDIIKKALKML